MNHLVPICVVGFMVLGAYKLVELFVRRKERLTLIEKLPLFVGNSADKQAINYPEISLFKRQTFNVLRYSLLLIGIGLGCLIAFVVQYFLLSSLDVYASPIRENLASMQTVIYFACIFIFGGLGLLIAYFIERKNQAGEKK